MTTFAIITRTKNRPLLLERAVRSVLGQQYQDWLHVVVNDVGDPAIVDALLEPHAAAYRGRLLVIHRTSSTGMESASNVGIAASSSEFIAIHDDDDRWDPGFLQTTHAYMHKFASVESLGGVVTHITRIRERIDGDKVFEMRRDIMNRWLRQATLMDVTGTFCWVPIGFIYKRSALMSIGPYREDLPVLGDQEFNFRFLRKWDIGVVPTALAYYHVREHSSENIDYQNSVINAEELFALHSTRLKNQWLREDLDQGRFGMGSLLNLCASLDLIQRNTRPLGRAFDKLLSSSRMIWILKKIGIMRDDAQ